MDNPDIPRDKKSFPCIHCNGLILVPRELPQTTAPCPYCGGMVTSPASDGPATAGAPAAPRIASPPAVPPPVPPPAPIVPLVASAPPDPAAPVTPAAATPAPQPASPAPRHVPRTPSTVQPEAAAKTGGFPIVLIALLLLCGGVLTYFVTKEMKREIPPPSVAPAEDLTNMDASYIRVGWQKDASRLLTDFLAADLAAKKLPFILNAESLAPRVRDFYGNEMIDDHDTPAGAFSVYELSEDDRKRGLFMMTYDQPPQFDMKEFFRPLASLEVQYGIDEADLLLSTVARAGNFAMEPLRVHAFFKKTPEGLKLDWEIYAQTKYRTFRNFTELPEPGHTGVFRVFIVEDVPDRGMAGQGFRTYRLSDPAHTEDSARVNVRADTELGRILSEINWRGTKEKTPLARTATVELEWSNDGKPTRLQLRRFICWEFLGLGGQDAKAAAK